VTKTTAQDASGSPIVSADDLRPDWFDDAHTLPQPIAAPEEAVDAAGPVDAQTRPPRLGKRRTVSHSAHRHPRPLDQGEKRQTDLTHGQRPANDNDRAPLRSPASSFADPSPAEIVVRNRQK
jgi:hypothetical protein